MNCGYIDEEDWKGDGFGFGTKELITLECPRSIYDRNNVMVDYLLQITSKGYDRSHLGYLDVSAAQDTIAVIKELNEWLRKEEEKKKSKP